MNRAVCGTQHSPSPFPLCPWRRSSAQRARAIELPHNLHISTMNSKVRLDPPRLAQVIQIKVGGGVRHKSELKVAMLDVIIRSKKK